MFYDANNFEIENDKHNHIAKKNKCLNDIYLWHLWLGNIEPNMIHGLVKSEILSLDFESILVCVSCLEGKLTKKPFYKICKRGGYEYFVTFIDDHSRYGYIYLIRQKSLKFLQNSKSIRLRQKIN